MSTSRADGTTLVFTDGSFSLRTIDEFIDLLLTEERVCEVQLPRMTLRKVLEESEGLSRRRSKLAKAMGVDLSDDEGSDASVRDRYKSRSPSVSGSDGEKERYLSRSASSDGSRRRSASPDGERFVSRSPSPAAYVSRSPTRSPEPENIMSVD